MTDKASCVSGGTAMSCFTSVAVCSAKWTVLVRLSNSVVRRRWRRPSSLYDEPRCGSTVRQTPFTATLSPRSKGSSNVARRRSRAPLSSRSSDSIVPLLMMMPVNMAHG